MSCLYANCAPCRVSAVTVSTPAPGRTAFIGVGFADRSDSFDMNVALQDHFKWVHKENQIEKEKTEPTQKLDLGFKEGQTIKINMKITVGRSVEPKC